MARSREICGRNHKQFNKLRRSFYGKTQRAKAPSPAQKAPGSERAEAEGRREGGRHPPAPTAAEGTKPATELRQPRPDQGAVSPGALAARPARLTRAGADSAMVAVAPQHRLAGECSGCVPLRQTPGLREAAAAAVLIQGAFWERPPPPRAKKGCSRCSRRALFLLRHSAPGR